jgi:hypothetical protein
MRRPPRIVQVKLHRSDLAEAGSLYAEVLAWFPVWLHTRSRSCRPNEPDRDVIA